LEAAGLMLLFGIRTTFVFADIQRIERTVYNLDRHALT